MSQTSYTGDLIKNFLAAVGDRDLDLMVACFDEDGAFDASGAERVIGQREIRFALAARLRQFTESVGDIITLEDDSGTRGAAEFTLRGEYVADAEGLPAASKQAYSLSAGLFCEVEEGRFLRLSLRYNPQDLLRQLQDD